MLDGTGRSK
ncbi:MAG: hypothetical protein EZS28_045966, partial [Streblomastix strix]